MSYADPYATRHQQYNEPYNQTPADYDPYNYRPHETYNQGGYQDGAYRDDPSYPTQAPVENVGRGKEVGFEEPTYAEAARTPPDSRGLRQWRADNQGNLWTSGSRPRCICRFFGCFILTVLFLLISIVLSLALWIQPPNIAIGDVQTSTSTSAFQLVTNGLQINLNVSIDVDNPNYFAVDFSKIVADIYYPINNTLIGGGNETNIKFPAGTNTNISFPFDIKYTTDIDPDDSIIKDLATKCIGGDQVTVDFKITLSLKVLFVTISPVVSSSTSFDCPITESEIEEIASSLGLSSILGDV